MKKKMSIVDYDLQWKVRYIEEKQKLVSVFGDLIKSIHHIGSTAVKITRAKPEIDILIVVKDNKELFMHDAAMEDLGYRVRGECLESGGTPGRFYYSKDVNSVRTHKVHICKTGHKDILDMLLFCKYLNEHPQHGKEYADLKEKLRVDYGYEDILKYLEGKKGFIKSTVDESKKEYGNLTEDDFQPGRI